jgi:ketosteroid isomerase-like protein
MTEDERAVRAVIERNIAAMQAGDADTIEALGSDRPGCITIGTDPDEWWDKASLMAAMRDELSAGGPRVGDSPIRVEAVEFTVHVHGDVAWVEGTGKVINEQGDERVVRNTGVLVREEDGEWRGVQAHASIGVPNQDIFKS